MRWTLAAIAVTAASCATPRAEGDAMASAKTAPPTEEPQGGFGPLGAQLSAMEKDAEAIVARERAASGDAANRYHRAALELFFAMRPEFGPANAALFNAREKQLRALAEAVGLAEPPPPLDFPVDDFVREVRGAAQALKDAGLDVTDGPTAFAQLLWQPGATAGWQLTVADPKRPVEETIPYAPPSAAPRTVPATIHLYAFPLVRSSASLSQVKREQPGDVLGATANAVFFRLQAPQSHDQDPKSALGATVRKQLFPDIASRDLADLAQRFNAVAVVLERGVLRVASLGPPPRKTPPRVEGANVVLWITESGMNRELTLLPLE